MTPFEKMKAEMLGKVAPVPQPSRKYKLGVLLISLSNPYWVAFKQGYEAAAKEYGVTVDILAAPSETDVAIQLDYLETMVNKGYDTLCISPITPFNLIPGIAKATKKGLPVVVAGTWIDEAAAKEAGAVGNRVFTTDYELEGYAGAMYIAERLKDTGGKVAVIEGLPGATASEARKAGALRAFKSFKSITVLGSQPGNWDRTTALNITMNLIQAHPDLKGIFCANDTMALAAVEALKSVGKKSQVMVVGVDFVPQAKESIEAGELDGSIAKTPFIAGYLAVITAIKILEKTPVTGVNMPIGLITQSNIADFADWK